MDYNVTLGLFQVWPVGAHSNRRGRSDMSAPHFLSQQVSSSTQLSQPRPCPPQGTVTPGSPDGFSDFHYEH